MLIVSKYRCALSRFWGVQTIRYPVSTASKYPPKPPSKRLYDLPMTRYSTSIFFLDHDVICGPPKVFEEYSTAAKNGAKRIIRQNPELTKTRSTKSRTTKHRKPVGEIFRMKKIGELFFFFELFTI
jgi:hypothetical protein